MSVRPTIVAGNWKMYKTISEAVDFMHEFLPLISQSAVDVYLAVPATCLAVVAELACDHLKLEIGAQNIAAHHEGAWTGEISNRQVKEAGATFVLLGHSERRHHFDEKDEIVNQKVRLAFELDLQPIVCFGETFSEREQGMQLAVVEKQLRNSLQSLSIEEISRLILAYEPVWAIGTGKNASPQMAQSMHHHCRQLMEDMWGKELADKIPLLYGGSVKEENAFELLQQADIDGLLVGGASLNAFTFNNIVSATVNP